jgi:hypothetical protein
MIEDPGLDSWIGNRAMVERAADEGVPIGALKRIFRVSDENLRPFLHDAIAAGRLVSMPSEDWPTGGTRLTRLPCVPQTLATLDDDDLVMLLSRKVKTTPQEGRLLLVILRRGHASREQLLLAADHGNQSEPSQIKLVDVVVCKMRKKLVPLGITLQTVHSLGYQMTEVDRRKIWELLKEAD